MKWFLILLVAGLGVLYYTTGIRIGMMPTTPMYGFNVQGKADYPFNMYDSGTITVTGSCKASAGKVTLSFAAPDGTILSGQDCVKGNWSINMTTQGKGGNYHVLAQYKHFTGRLDLDSTAKIKY